MSESAGKVNIQIAFRNMEATEALKSYTVEKLSGCIQKFIHRNTEAHVVLKIEKNRQIAEVTFHSEGHDFAAKEESQDMYASIDQLVSSLTQQLRRHKERLTSHH